MSNSNGKIMAPINIESDIASVLGVSSADIGYLCRNEHGKINPLSKYKSIRADKKGELTESEWRSYNYGYHIPAQKGLQILIGVYRGDESLPSDWIAPSTTGTYSFGNGWWWEPPTGGDQTPYRSTDFDGYDHNEKVGLMSFEINSRNLTEDSVFSAYLFFQSGVDLSIFGGLQGGHLGIVAICITGQGKDTYKFSSVLASDIVDPTIRIDAAHIKKFFPFNGDYKIIPFVTNKSAQNYYSDGTGYVSSPDSVTVAFPLPVDPIIVSMGTSAAVDYFNFIINEASIIKESAGTFKLKLRFSAKNITENSQYFFAANLSMKYNYRHIGASDVSADYDAAVAASNKAIAAGETAEVFDGYVSLSAIHNDSGFSPKDDFEVDATLFYKNSNSETKPIVSFFRIYSSNPSPIL